MPGEISLRETERRMFAIKFQDGLIDIAIGCFLLVFVIGPYLSPALGDFWATVVVFLPLWMIILPALWLVRRYVVTPRIGFVKFGAWRVSRVKRFNVVVLIVLVLSSILGLLSAVEFDAVPGWVHSARFSLVFLLIFSITAYFLDLTRLYVYGILIALGYLTGELLYQYLKVPHHGIPVTFGFGGLAITLTGVILFVRFLRDHPQQPGQAEAPERIEDTGQ
ncbi:MAG: hypothetical protein ACK2TX_10675 [Anaerolineales bacterium]